MGAALGAHGAKTQSPESLAGFVHMVHVRLVLESFKCHFGKPWGKKKKRKINKC